uniref:Methyltransferase FkbM domain-containing protein n=1 Tax=Alexandrium catenella TaxID=2925 RepID=A0A7S1SDR1_ALECA|mmetsp:Transcript_96909/g.257537  ORF Transcript_96909/g.257537 Transcript_96909/m.257537 type:complete len:349 (+) Transcript_96909:79-1125(+)|eukprot:CAMPEP_0171275328 /NCGR_PEP_ID=MMETSP0790-20130122/63266_1 /TAXON_ID=2925 /ORGANISM="Alexandrium catenella, Strain OF101" /LENGTH=348 /DNA_ID=CAMNT_0011744389 /DNA_START=78 /DNA_END=1124 /DNA_ORIENTATION=-
MVFKFHCAAAILLQCSHALQPARCQHGDGRPKHALQPARWQHGDGRPKPEFVNCAQHGASNVLQYSRLSTHACGTDLPLLLVRDVIKPLVQYEQSVVRPRGRKPIIMHLGANTFSERPLVGQVLADLEKRSGEGAFRVVLVEMVSQFNPYIMKAVAELPVAPAKVQLVNAMIQGHCQAPSARYYFVSSRLWKDYPEVGNLLDAGFGCATTDRKRVERCTAFHIKTFTPFAHPEKINLTRYITEHTARCLEPRQLLEEIRAEPSDLAYLTTDCEGADAGIVRSLLHEGVRAPFISMEGAPSSAPIAELRRAGYKIGVHCEGDCANPDDPFGGVKDTIGIRAPALCLHQE